MVRTKALIAVLLLLIIAGGCSWPAWLGWLSQPNKASEAVEYTPGQGVAPANGFGYVDGQPLDERTKH